RRGWEIVRADPSPRRSRARSRRRRVFRAARPVGLRQDDALADDRRSSDNRSWRDLSARRATLARSTGTAEYRDGVSGLRALSPYERLPQHGLRFAPARPQPQRDRRPRPKDGGAARNRAAARAPASSIERRPATARRA